MMQVAQSDVSNFLVWIGLTVCLWVAMAAFGMVAGFILGLLKGETK